MVLAVARSSGPGTPMYSRLRTLEAACGSVDDFAALERLVEVDLDRLQDREFDARLVHGVETGPLIDRYADLLGSIVDVDPVEHVTRLAPAPKEELHGVVVDDPRLLPVRGLRAAGDRLRVDHERLATACSPTGLVAGWLVDLGVIARPGVATGTAPGIGP